MTYVLSSLGADKSKAPSPIDTLLAQFGAVALESAKAAVRANMTRYQAYNMFRFNDPNIKSSKDKKLKDLIKRDSANVLTKATPAYKAYELGCVAAAMAINFTPKPSAKQIGKVAYDGWKQLWASVIGSDKAPDDGDAGAESASDNTLLWVGGAVVLALVAIGASRNRSAP